MPLEQFVVSVIVPVFNGEALLAAAVSSIQEQRFEALEIIVVDDGSTDGTARVVEGLEGEIRYVYQPNRGAPAARARGLTLAKGNVIAFLDADDLWSENKLERQLACLAEEPSVDIVLGHTQYIREVGSERGEQKFEKAPDSWPALSFGAGVFRKSVFEKVGLPDRAFRFDDDVDWFLRANELGVTMRVLPEVTLYYRRHHGNITNQRDTNQRYFLTALKRSLDRRRSNDEARARPLSGWLDGENRDTAD